MKNYDKVKEVFKTIQAQVIDSTNVTGIEIASLKKDGVYTSDLCIRVLVNSKNVTNKDLNIPESVDGIAISVTYKTIFPQ
ncbi:hypothetical protein AAFN75_16555 [Algibacter sp. AS12]|uniref:hypothetical protein n=1 Tax=Algibacter sp. AS12 TaxID=3135773 RepID=UPI00398B0AFA